MMLILRKDGTVLADTGSYWDLSEQDLRGVNFRGIVLEGGNLSDSDLRSTDFSGSDLYGTDFYRADLDSSNFEGALLRGVVLDEALLRGANFQDAKLLANNMGTACCLLGADLRGANLQGAVLTNCEYNGATLFPVGFDPEVRGMKLIR